MKTLYTIAAVFGALTAIATGILLSGRGLAAIGLLYRNTIGKKAALYRKLNRLAPGVQVGYFTSILGPVVFMNSGKQYDEHVYVDRYFFVQAIADKTGRVALFSVTTRDHTFNPPVWKRDLEWAGVPEWSRYRLGQFTFASISNRRASGVVGWVGNRRRHYAECFLEVGLPGSEQLYLFAVNDAGAITRATSDGLLSVFSLPHPRSIRLGNLDAESLDPDFPFFSTTDNLVEVFLQQQAVQDFRGVAVPNTYSVTGLRVATNVLEDRTVGVNADDVAILGKE